MSTAWIDLETAAKRSGKSVGHLARTAANKWRGEGKAQLRQPAEGGKPRWQIREDADAAFALIKTADQTGVDLRQYTAKQREEAWRREKILKEWDEFCRNCYKIGFDRMRATHSFVERLLIEQNVRVSRATLYNWHNAYRAGGIAGLIDGRTGKDSGKDAAGSSIDQPDPFLAEVQRLYLSLRQPKLTKVVAIAEHLAIEKGWTVRSYKTCQRFINALPASLVIKMRGGEDAFVAQAQTWIEKDYTSIDSNDAWCADHHQFDVICQRTNKTTGEVVRFRPWLSVFQDIRSRKIMGWVIVDHDPNTDVILSAFRAAVLTHGVPRMLIIDNGKDYDSYALNGRTKKDRWAKSKARVELDPQRTAGLFPELGIDVRHVWPYHGQSKPIERWFGELEQNTFVWPTYCGRSTQHKPEDLQLQLERGKAPNLTDFTQWFSDWLTAHEASHRHQGDGMNGQTPDAVYAACLHTKRTAPADLLDLLCLRREGPLKVGRNGVTYKGIRYGQHDLARHLGDEVMIRVDERDISHVQVYTINDQLICIAASNEKIGWGADAQTLRQAIAAKKSDTKFHKDFVNRRPRLTDDLPERIIAKKIAQAAAIAAEAGPTPPGPTLQPIRHALEGQLPAIQRAVDATSNRQAVGSESVPLPGKFTYQSDSWDAQESSTDTGMSFRELMAGRDASQGEHHE